jgi:hypothetical protein
VVVISLQTTFSLASNVTLFDLADGIQKCVNSCRSSAEVCQFLGSQKRIFRGKRGGSPLGGAPIQSGRDLKRNVRHSGLGSRKACLWNLYEIKAFEMHGHTWSCMHMALKTPGPWHSASISSIQCGGGRSWCSKEKLFLVPEDTETIHKLKHGVYMLVNDPRTFIM